MLRRAAARPAETLFDRPPAPVEQADGERAEPPATSLRRWHLVARIIELNTTASEDYLEDFSDESLSRYLAHLESMGSPRGARWERPGDSPAIMVRETEF